MHALALGSNCSFVSDLKRVFAHIQKVQALVHLGQFWRLVCRRTLSVILGMSVSATPAAGV